MRTRPRHEDKYKGKKWCHDRHTNITWKHDQYKTKKCKKHGNLTQTLRRNKNTTNKWQNMKSCMLQEDLHASRRPLNEKKQSRQNQDTRIGAKHESKRIQTRLEQDYKTTKRGKKQDQSRSWTWTKHVPGKAEINTRKQDHWDHDRKGS